MMDCILKYLSELELNNNREWYHDHKQQYLEANGAFEALIRDLMRECMQFDGSIQPADPKTLKFKLVRDTRFSHDKSPYNPAFRAHISSKGKLPVPVGYFVMIKPGNRSFLGGGLFADMFQNATTMVRDYLVTHEEEWERILSNPDFAARFAVKGSALKNVPKGYDSSHPQAAYLKNKSWYLEYPVTDGQLRDPQFADAAGKLFVTMKPFNDYFNQALDGFTMPAR